jgi:hypothetical protein
VIYRGDPVRRSALVCLGAALTSKVMKERSDGDATLPERIADIPLSDPIGYMERT